MTSCRSFKSGVTSRNCCKAGTFDQQIAQASLCRQLAGFKVTSFEMDDAVLLALRIEIEVQNASRFSILPGLSLTFSTQQEGLTQYDFQLFTVHADKTGRVGIDLWDLRR